MTCINKAEKGGCQLQNRFCNYPDCDKPVTKEMVNHPKHYNGHPSGIECIELVRLLSFNLGNAVKYVMRRDDKGTAKQDLQKAMWYLKDEVAHYMRSAMVAELPMAVSLIDKITLMEENRYARDFYRAVSDSLRYQIYTAPQPKHLFAMMEAVQSLTKTYD